MSTLRNITVYITILIFLLIAISCNKNKVVLSKSKTIEILTDIHYVEGLSNEHIAAKDSREYKLGMYKSLYAKHNTTKEQVDSTIRFYMQDIKQYAKMYEKVLDNLQTIEARVKSGEFSKSDSTINNALDTLKTTTDLIKQ